MRQEVQWSSNLIEQGNNKVTIIDEPLVRKLIYNSNHDDVVKTITLDYLLGSSEDGTLINGVYNYFYDVPFIDVYNRDGMYNHLTYTNYMRLTTSGDYQRHWAAHYWESNSGYYLSDEEICEFDALEEEMDIRLNNSLHVCISNCLESLYYNILIRHTLSTPPYTEIEFPFMLHNGCIMFGPIIECS